MKIFFVKRFFQHILETWIMFLRLPRALSQTDCVIVGVGLGLWRGFVAKKCVQRRGMDVARCFGQNTSFSETISFQHFIRFLFIIIFYYIIINLK
jgi:hypothetical protein